MAKDYSINIDREPVIMGILNVTPDSLKTAEDLLHVWLCGF